MKERVIKCAICGNEFKATSGRAKYCSDKCRNKANALKRKEWEKRSGYNEKQRDKMRITREKSAKEKKAKALNDFKTKRKEVAEKNQRDKAELIYKASSGDPIARMIISLRKHKSKSNNFEYWEAYKDYLLEFEKESGIKQNAFVNGVCVYDPEFPEKVMATINESKTINIYSN